MVTTRPIPVRLPEDVIARLDAAAKRIGSTRAGVIRFCTEMWLDHFEKVGVTALPIDWRKVVDSFDGRRQPSSASSGSSKASKAVDRLLAEAVEQVKQRRRPQGPRE